MKHENRYNFPILCSRTKSLGEIKSVKISQSYLKKETASNKTKLKATVEQPFNVQVDTKKNILVYLHKYLISIQIGDFSRSVMRGVEGMSLVITLY